MDVIELSKVLIDNPIQGKSLGNNFYKVRLSVTSKNKGKSGGARVITYLKITETIVYLAFIYDKTEKGNITDKELEQIFKLIP